MSSPNDVILCILVICIAFFFLFGPLPLCWGLLGGATSYAYHNLEIICMVLFSSEVGIQTQDLLVRSERFSNCAKNALNQEKQAILHNSFISAESGQKSIVFLYFDNFIQFKSPKCIE